MEQKIKTLIWALLVGSLVITSCKKEPEPEPPKLIEITGLTKLTGNLKLGKAVQIDGVGFEQTDIIKIIDPVETDTLLRVMEIIVSDSKQKLLIYADYLEFGIDIKAKFIDKNVQLFLEREGFEDLLLGAVKLVTPTIDEGYVADANLRNRLKMVQDANEQLYNFIDKYQLLDVVKANACNGCWDEGGFKTGRLTITDNNYETMSGIEHFKNITEIRSWGGYVATKVDMSKNTKLKMWLAGDLRKGLIPPASLDRLTISDESECEELDFSQAASLNTFGFKNAKKMYLLNICRTEATWAKAMYGGLPSWGRLDYGDTGFSYAPLSPGDTRERVIKVNFTLIKKNWWGNGLKGSLVAAYNMGVKIKVYDDATGNECYQENFNPNLMLTDDDLWAYGDLSVQEVKNNALDPDHPKTPKK